MPWPTPFWAGHGHADCQGEKGRNVQVNPAPAALLHMAEAVRTGKPVIPIGQRVALADAAKAHAAAEKGAAGKLLLLA